MLLHLNNNNPQLHSLNSTDSCHYMNLGYSSVALIKRISHLINFLQTSCQLEITVRSIRGCHNHDHYQAFIQQILSDKVYGWTRLY